MREISDILVNIKDTVIELEDVYNYTREKESQLDKMVIQLEHELELSNLDAVALVKKAKELKGVFRLRRKYKNKMEILLRARETYSLKASEKVIQSCKDKKKSQQYKQFKDRVSEQIRQEILKEVEVFVNE